MDNPIGTIIPEGGMPDKPTDKPIIEKPIIKPAAPKKPTLDKLSSKPAKPLVEGINSPKNTQDVILVRNNLSQKEQELVTETPEQNQAPVLNKPEPRLMPDSVIASVNKKDHHIWQWLVVFVVLVILVVGGYELYAWELNRGQEPVVGHYHAVVDLHQQSVPEMVATTTPGQISSSTPSAVATTTPAAPVLQVKINSTPTGFLNVRNAPSSSGKVLTQVHPGEVYTYVNVQNGWYEITYSGFSQGWVSGQYVTKQ